MCGTHIVEEPRKREPRWLHDAEPHHARDEERGGRKRESTKEPQQCCEATPTQIGVPTITRGRNEYYDSTHVLKGRLKQQAKHK